MLCSTLLFVVFEVVFVVVGCVVCVLVVVLALGAVDFEVKSS